ncbi:MAG: hypothetical protein QXW80_05235 [Candidatus Micrarchaeia archaeon]
MYHDSGNEDRVPPSMVEKIVNYINNSLNPIFEITFNRIPNGTIVIDHPSEDAGDVLDKKAGVQKNEIRI